MPLSDVCHQEEAQRLLQRALTSDRLPHAYIFFGRDGVGKEMLAQRLAALLLCESPIETPPLEGLDRAGRDACGQCASCKLAAAGNHPDLHIVHRQLNAYHPDQTVRNRKALDLGVEVVRHFLIEPAGRSAAMAHGKVFIVREADRITSQAQNALLKTLEEPPAGTFLILLASSLDQLLPTTRSRCQIVPFALLPTAFVAEVTRGQNAELSEADTKLYAALAQGSAAAALQYAEDELAAYWSTLGDMLAGLTQDTAGDAAKSIIDFAKEGAGRYRQRDAELSDTAAQRQALRAVFVLIAMWYRDRMAQAAGAAELSGRPTGSETHGLSPAAAAQAIRLVATTERQLELNVNVQLCIESLLYKLVRLPAQSHVAFA